MQMITQTRDERLKFGDALTWWKHEEFCQRTKREGAKGIGEGHHSARRRELLELARVVVVRSFAWP